MKMLSALAEYLAQSGDWEPAKQTAAASDVRLWPVGKRITDDALEIAHTRYTASIDVELVPSDELLGYRLQARLAAWLLDHDCDRPDDLEAPSIEVFDNEDGTVDLMIEVQFIERIFVSRVADDQNKKNVTHLGGQWNLAEPEIWTAEDVDVISRYERGLVPQ